MVNPQLPVMSDKRTLNVKRSNGKVDRLDKRIYKSTISDQRILNKSSKLNLKPNKHLPVKSIKRLKKRNWKVENRGIHIPKTPDMRQLQSYVKLNATPNMFVLAKSTEGLKDRNTKVYTPIKLDTRILQIDKKISIKANIIHTEKTIGRSNIKILGPSIFSRASMVS